jgi:hypothetical protein
VTTVSTLFWVAKNSLKDLEMQGQAVVFDMRYVGVLAPEKQGSNSAEQPPADTHTSTAAGTSTVVVIVLASTSTCTCTAHASALTRVTTLRALVQLLQQNL